MNTPLIKNVFRVCMILFHTFLTNVHGQSNTNRLIESKLDAYYEVLEKNWNVNGYWGKAAQQKDNRYNEAILFYQYKELKNPSDTSIFPKIKKAIYYSFNFLQHEDGGMLQENIPVHVRTSLFLEAIAKVAVHHPEILKDSLIREGIMCAVNWLKEPHEFAFNHNIAAMLAFNSLSKLYDDKIFKQLELDYRKLLLENFIAIDKYHGYWPEAPETWSNRLNKPYLLVQSMFLNAYIMQENDSEIQKLYQKLNRYILSQINLEKGTISIENSLGHFDANQKEVPVSCVSFFQAYPARINMLEKKNKKLLHKLITHFDAGSKKAPVLLYTDLYYRFTLGISSNK
ncbi:hypothetical protein [Ascidiimonas sp. W6]|uniref:hypothetical protein n=1 Tax=Ascidiimonas meishanensis TaxID=3128903 RepID=UPI0030EB7D2E